MLHKRNSIFLCKNQLKKCELILKVNYKKIMYYSLFQKIKKNKIICFKIMLDVNELRHIRF